MGVDHIDRIAEAIDRLTAAVEKQTEELARQTVLVEQTENNIRRYEEKR